MASRSGQNFRNRSGQNFRNPHTAHRLSSWLDDSERGGIGKVGPWYLAVPLNFEQPEAAQANQLLATVYANRSAARARTRSFSGD
jgi:hypothetical protein